VTRESIRARVEAATPAAEWLVKKDNRYFDQQDGRLAHLLRYHDNMRPNVLMVAHAPADLAALLAVADAAAEMLDEVVCHATSGGTGGKWCIEHDRLMLADATDCEAARGWRDALAALEALP
jgi:hypothetical protein